MIDAEEFLVNVCSAMGIDCSELSPFRRYVIRPVAQLFQRALSEAGKFMETMEAIVENDPSRVDPAVLDALLSVFGLEAEKTVPTTGKVKLVPSTSWKTFARLTREYGEGEVTFEWGGYRFVCKGFVAGSSGAVADFRCDDPDSFVPAGTVVPLSHPDFSEAVVLECVKGKRGSLDVLKYVAERLERASFAATEHDIRLVVAKELLLDPKDVYVVGANHPMMFADLSEAGEHLGGFVDVYVPAVHVDVARQAVTEPVSVIEERLKTRARHLSVSGPSKRRVPIDDTNIPKSFLAPLLGEVPKDSQAVLLEGPVSDVVAVEVAGRRLKENVDYTVVPLDRAWTFSARNAVLVVLSGAFTERTSLVLVCSEAVIPAWDQEKHEIVCATVTPKAKVPVWLAGDVRVVGEVDWVGLQKELSTLSSLTESDFALLLKKHGARSVDVRKLRARLVSQGFGFFEKDLPVSLSDFSIFVPAEAAQLCVTEAHLRGE